MPTVDLAIRHDLNRDPISNAIIFLAEFHEDGSSEYVRLASNNEDVEFEGNVFTRSDIQITSPSSGENDPSSSLTISNVNRVVGKVIDSTERRINVRLILVDTSNLDKAILDTKNLMVIPSASGNTETITASLGPRADQQEPVPFKRTTQSEFPGLWFA